MKKNKREGEREEKKSSASSVSFLGFFHRILIKWSKLTVENGEWYIDHDVVQDKH